MTKQIIITQGNFNIAINNTFINEDKTVRDITGYTCTVDIVYPDKTSENLPVEIIDAVNGKVCFILGGGQTIQLKVHKLYFNLVDANSLITAQDMITYYVQADKGGIG